jgi:hypothetical protein
MAGLWRLASEPEVPESGIVALTTIKASMLEQSVTHHTLSQVPQTTT